MIFQHLSDSQNRQTLLMNKCRKTKSRCGEGDRDSNPRRCGQRRGSGCSNVRARMGLVDDEGRPF